LGWRLSIDAFSFFGYAMLQWSKRSLVSRGEEFGLALRLLDTVSNDTYEVSKRIFRTDWLV
jgi:hypothetical protein